MRTRSLAQMRKQYGPRYPAAIRADGRSHPLYEETRWKRVYGKPDGDRFYLVSRFIDGSAQVSLAELRREWDSWSPAERLDLGQNLGIGWLNEHAEAADIFRFVLHTGDERLCSALAIACADVLPRAEAFAVLRDVADRTAPARAVNLLQGIAMTKHPKAAALLKDHLKRLWLEPGLMQRVEDDINWSAYAAICCIAHLIEHLGAKPRVFAKQVRMLATHPCPRVRQSCRDHLGRSYPDLT